MSAAPPASLLHSRRGRRKHPCHLELIRTNEGSGYSKSLATEVRDVIHGRPPWRRLTYDRQLRVAALLPEGVDGDARVLAGVLGLHLRDDELVVAHVRLLVVHLEALVGRQDAAIVLVTATNKNKTTSQKPGCAPRQFIKKLSLK